LNSVSERDLALLSSYIDGEVSVDERAEVESRLRTDPDFARELASLRAVKALIGELPTLTAPRNFTLTPAQVGTMPSRRAIAFPTVVSGLSAAAAALLFVIGAGLLLRPAASEMPPLSDAIALAPTVAVTELATESPAAPIAILPQATSPAATQTSDSGEIMMGMVAEPSDTDAPGMIAIAPPEQQAEESQTELFASEAENAADAMPSAQGESEGLASGSAVAQSPLPTEKLPTPTPSSAPTVTASLAPTLIATEIALLGGSAQERQSAQGSDQEVSREGETSTTPLALVLMIAGVIVGAISAVYWARTRGS
jgi:hypothetical protein